MEEKMESNKIILTGRNSEEIISNGNYPITPDICRSLLQLAQSEADEVQTQAKLGLIKTLAEWKNRVANLKQKLADLQNQVINLEQLLKNMEPGSRFEAALFLVSAIICSISEVMLSLATIPWLLGFTSSLGILVALSTVAGVTVLKVIFARLFENHYRQKKTVSNWQGKLKIFAVSASMMMFLVILGWLNIKTIASMGEARQEINTISTAAEQNADANLSADKMQISLAAIDEFVLLLSLTVCIDGAILLLWGLQETKKIQQFNQTSRELAELRESESGILRQLEESDAELKKSEESFAQAEMISKSVALRYLEERRIRLFEKIAKSKRFASASFCEYVEDNLMGRGSYSEFDYLSPHLFKD
jgi:hypothetical protein